MILPRLYPILDTAALAARGMDPETAARVALEAGVKILQFRHKGHYSRAVFAQAERIAGLCRQAGALFIVDDRADIAALVGAGVHVGQDDLPPAEARRIAGAEAVVGFSTHNAGQLRAAAEEPADYLAIGPIFGTQSKEKPDPAVGLEALPGLRKLAGKPLVAIGGITRATAAAVLEAGADSVAVIADLLPDPLTAAALRERMEEWLTLLK
jgi:thiamine-phosphate pyrophosphorylase